MVNNEAEAVYSQRGELLNRTEDIVGWWIEHFEELLNPNNPPSMIEAALEDDGGSASVFLKEVTEVVEQLHSSKAPGIDCKDPGGGLGVRPSSLHVFCGFGEGV